MVEKELAERDTHVLNAIQYLGDRGVLDEPEPIIGGLPDPEISKMENNEKVQAVEVENPPGDDVPVPASPVKEQVVDGLLASQS
jgi:hypothetical protein